MRKSDRKANSRYRGNDLAFNMKLLNLRNEAMNLGLLVTARAIDNAVKAVGWEQAGEITKAASYAPSFEGK